MLWSDSSSYMILIYTRVHAHNFISLPWPDIWIWSFINMHLYDTASLIWSDLSICIWFCPSLIHTYTCYSFDSWLGSFCSGICLWVMIGLVFMCLIMFLFYCLTILIQTSCPHACQGFCSGCFELNSIIIYVRPSLLVCAWATIQSLSTLICLHLNVDIMSSDILQF